MGSSVGTRLLGHRLAPATEAAHASGLPVEDRSSSAQLKGLTPLNGVWEEQVVVEVESAGWIGSQPARHITSGVFGRKDYAE